MFQPNNTILIKKEAPKLKLPNRILLDTEVWVFFFFFFYLAVAYVPDYEDMQNSKTI